MIKMTEEEYLSLTNEYGGVCLSCKDIVYNVEPDACNYHCESCGENQVFGVEEALMRADIQIANG